MGLLLIVFLFVLTVVLSLVLVATRRSPDQQAMERRVATIMLNAADRGTAGPLIPPHLEVKEPGAFKGLDMHLGGTWVFRKVQLMIVQGQTSTSVGAVIASMLGILLGVTGLTYLLTTALPLALGLGFAGAYGPIAYLRFRRDRRIAAFNAALPECIEMCARSLRVGHSIVAAIDIVAKEAQEPARTEFQEVFNKQNYGLSLRDAFLQMLDRVPSMDLRVLVTGILVQKDTGGNLAEIMDRIVMVIRERLQIKREIQTHTAQGRLTGWILCLLPVVLLFVINVVDPGYSKVLFHEEIGRKLLYGAAGLLLVGVFVIRQIVNGIEV